MQKIIIKILMKVIVERLSTKKYLLSETNEQKIEYLFILESLF